MILPRHVGYDETSDLNPVGFERRIYAIDGRRTRYPVVADEGVGQDKKLPLVRGIGQSFGISHHTRIKYHFTSGGHGEAESLTGKRQAIFQEQKSPWAIDCHHNTSFMR
jgi:hypothetical protein